MGRDEQSVLGDANTFPSHFHTVSTTDRVIFKYLAFIHNLRSKWVFCDFVFVV